MQRFPIFGENRFEQMLITLSDGSKYPFDRTKPPCHPDFSLLPYPQEITYSIMPAMAAVSRHAKVPPIRALIPSCERTPLLLGAKEPIPPI